MKYRVLLQFCLIIYVLSWQLTLAAAYPDYENIYVNDWANLLDEGAKARITQDLKSLRSETGVEITLVTIGRMSDYAGTKRTIEGFALELFNQWGVGDASKNDGVLVLVSHYDRKMRIATGRAYDDTRKNREAKRIIDESFIPSFKRDNYQQGILNGMARVISAFDPTNIPNEHTSLPVGFMDSESALDKQVNNDVPKASNKFMNSRYLVFIVIFAGIVMLNLFNTTFSSKFSNKSVTAEHYTQGNYAIDKQPKNFKPKFPNEKKVDIRIYLGFFLLGLIALLFVAAFIGFVYVKPAFLALLAGLGFNYGLAEFKMRKRNKPKTCPRCSNLMDRLSERLDDKYLQLPERVEESLKSVDYDVWICDDCQRTKKLRYPYWQSKVAKCKQCEFITLEIDINTLKTATTSREGLEEVIEDCKYCDYHHEYEQVIPQKVESSDSSSSSSSFGGGSSSGGGASGSW